MKTKNYSYIVELHTELGKKKGILELCVKGKKIDGFLSLFKHREPVIGRFMKDGNCELKGKIITLIRENKYIATGKLQEKEVNLNFAIGKKSYPLTGTEIF